LEEGLRVLFDLVELSSEGSEAALELVEFVIDVDGNIALINARLTEKMLQRVPQDFEV
jgi:hypothetical protein